MVFKSPIYFPNIGPVTPPPGNLGIDVTDCMCLFSPYAAHAGAPANCFRLVSGLTNVPYVDGVADQTVTQNAPIETWFNQISGKPNLVTPQSDQLYRRGSAPVPADLVAVFNNGRRAFNGSGSYGFNQTGFTTIHVLATTSGSNINGMVGYGAISASATSHEIIAYSNGLRLGRQGSNLFVDYNTDVDFTTPKVLSIKVPANGSPEDLEVYINDLEITPDSLPGGTIATSGGTDNGMILMNQRSNNASQSFKGAVFFTAFFNNLNEVQRLANVAALRSAFGI